MMKNVLLILLALTLFFAVSASAEEESPLLGKPFPDFTVTDTDGNAFTLSEELKDHEAVLINFWATWLLFRQEYRQHFIQLHGSDSGIKSFKFLRCLCFTAVIPGNGDGKAFPFPENFRQCFIQDVRPPLMIRY